jgi:hypothetical protein
VIKIKIVLIIISIVGIIFTSSGLAIPNAQSASDEGNNAQSTSDDDNKAQTSDDDNKAQTSDDDNILTFNQDLLPDLSPSNQKIIEKTPSGTLNQSGNLQNPSIQTELNQSLPYCQKDVQLQQSKKPPSAEDCVLANDSKSANCPTMEAYDAWAKLQQAARVAAATEGSDNKAINLGQPWDLCDRSDTNCNNNFEAFKRLFEDMKNAFGK